MSLIWQNCWQLLFFSSDTDPYLSTHPLAWSCKISLEALLLEPYEISCWLIVSSWLSFLVLHDYFPSTSVFKVSEYTFWFPLCSLGRLE